MYSKVATLNGFIVYYVCQIRYEIKLWGYHWVLNVIHMVPVYQNDLYVSYLEVITMHIQIPFLKNFAS